MYIFRYICRAEQQNIAKLKSMGCVQVRHGEGCETDVLLGSEQGLMTRIMLDNVPFHKGRAGKGSRVMKLRDGDSVHTVTPIWAQLPQS